MSAGVIVTAAGPTMRDVLHELALPSFRRYASRWGWDVVVEDLPRDGSGADPGAQQAKWAKTRLLREGLTSHEFALWVDADVLLLRDDDDLLRHLAPEAFQGLVLEHVPTESRINPNTGVWLMRSCPRALAFLDAVEAAGPQPGPWADQGAVLAALGWHRGDDRYHGAAPPRSGTPGTCWLPPAWNAPYVDGRTDADCFNSTAASYADRPPVPDPVALHFMGLTPEARRSAMCRAASDQAAGRRAA